MQHRGRALAFTFAVTFVPVLGVLGILIAALMTLRKGIVDGAAFTLAATLPIVLGFFVTGSGVQTASLMVWAVLGVAVVSNLLTWAFAVMLARHASWSQILQLAALLGVLAISLIHMAYPDVGVWWGLQLQDYYNQAAALASNGLQAGTEAAQSHAEAISVSRFYATGVMVSGVLFNALVQLAVARWWESALYSPDRLRKELHHIRLSPLAGALFVLAMGLAYYGNEVVLDMMPVLYLLFVVAGLSLVHYFFGLMQSKTAFFWLVLFYAVLIYSTLGVSGAGGAFLVVMMALADIWLDFRKRFKKS
ncbi:MAG: hypothetical protein A3E85_05770 [Gammaproteobacteria bacterium RIFCSPHIGHO2_12_FULL_45_12]|nr:MAG: hypothetical protein A3E85_05770 [Gammaproteobacteria bacterium RIFCSPHIGHO2_12_FULL_45_12]